MKWPGMNGCGQRLPRYARRGVREVGAAVLELAEKTVYTMAQAGEILAFKIRG